MNRHARTTSLLLATIVAAGACANDEVMAPASVTLRPALSASTSLPAEAPWAEVIVGETGPGSMYELRMPRNWTTRSVVYYEHGFNDPTDALALPFKENIEATFKVLGEKGYAIAASSFSENGFAVKDGMQRTHQLRGLFTSRFGRAEKSYLMGHSLGGAIVVALAEKYPNQYDGALAMCGMVGGSQLQIDYLGNVRAAFDAIYPGVLRGTAVDIPADLTRQEVETKATQAMSANPLGALALARLLPLPADAPLSSVPAQIGGVVAALSFHVRGGRDVIDHTQGHNAFDNTTTVYGGGFGPYGADFFNATIARFTASPDARNYLELWFEPTGDLRIPVMTLHTMWDPAVPTAHERKLASVVNAAGRGEMLRQNTGALTNAFNHCGFGTAEVVSNFEQLVAWVASLQ
jgi:pimeloyl-ACP methyl ester carboxylesterase